MQIYFLFNLLVSLSQNRRVFLYMYIVYVLYYIDLFQFFFQVFWSLRSVEIIDIKFFLFCYNYRFFLFGFIFLIVDSFFELEYKDRVFIVLDIFVKVDVF